MDEIRNFILIFDHENHVAVSQLDCGNNLELATEEYSRLERKYSDHDAIDVVLLGSDALATIQQTHADYFEGNSRRLMGEALSLFG